MKTFLDRAAMQHHPLRVLETFLEQEQAHEQAQQYEAMRFVGYVLDIGYETITIITSDPFKIAVGGIPRNSLLIMVPASLEGLPLHFTLLRVLESAPTPLTKEVQQTYFELQKKSMPELDVFTQSELQWGALKTGVLGMFYYLRVVWAMYFTEPRAAPAAEPFVVSPAPPPAPVTAAASGGIAASVAVAEPEAAPAAPVATPLAAIASTPAPGPRAIPLGTWLALALAAVLTLVLGIVPGVLFDAARQAAAALLR